MGISALESWKVWHSAVLAYRDCKQRYAAMKEVDAFEQEEGSLIVGECGSSGTELRSAMDYAFASRVYLPEAMRSLGIDADTFEASNASWHRSLRRTCMLCAERRRCEAALAAGAFETAYRDFCANGTDLAALSSGKSVAPR
ncbi:MAG: hypothetical protein LCH86_19490 [Proteobacteria bacterium]|nr:hypothetical protein [Pseudomonadota bacterium]